MKREKIIAGNWKMNTNSEEGLKLAKELSNLPGLHGKKVLIFPPFTSIESIQKFLVQKDSEIQVGAQNCHFETEGAYTGEISPKTLCDLGIGYVILGHSERRQYFCESNQDLAKKTTAALKFNIVPIYCCGETLTEREADKHFEIVKSQISEGLFHLSPSEMEKIIIAYEPVWAIGTGKTASPDQAQEMHAFIRDLINAKYGENISNIIPILYGGSVKPDNAAEIFAKEDIDGALVGGASLKADNFSAIINAA